MKPERIQKIRNSVYMQVKTRGFATIVDTFMDIGILEEKQYEMWKRGQVPYLEKVCLGNLNKLSDVIKEIYNWAKHLDLKESFTYYKKIGKGKKVQLRFSKSGSKDIEKRYSTHFVSKNKEISENQKIENIIQSGNKYLSENQKILAYKMYKQAIELLKELGDKYNKKELYRNALKCYNKISKITKKMMIKYDGRLNKHDNYLKMLEILEKRCEYIEIFVYMSRRIEIGDIETADNEIALNFRNDIIFSKSTPKWEQTETDKGLLIRIKASHQLFEFLSKYETFCISGTKIQRSDTDFGVDDIGFYDKDEILLLSAIPHEGIIDVDRDIAKVMEGRKK